MYGSNGYDSWPAVVAMGDEGGDVRWPPQGTRKIEKLVRNPTSCRVRSGKIYVYTHDIVNPHLSIADPQKERKAGVLVTLVQMIDYNRRGIIAGNTSQPVASSRC